MPRRIFPASTVTNATGAPLRLEFYPTSTATRREADLWTVDGSSNLLERIPNGIVLTDAVGAYDAFAGPDDLDVLYALPSNTTSRTTLTATSTVAGGSTVDSAVFAKRANNLSDLASAATSRTNLGLGSAAVLASSAVAQTANNLSDLTVAATARTNLGLGASAVMSTATIAADSALTGAFAPLTTSVWVPSTAFVPTPATDTFGNIGNGDGFNRTGALLFDQTAYENAYALFRVPPAWTAADIDLWWANGSSGSGNVIWRITVGSYGDGDDSSASYVSSSDITVAAPAQYVFKKTAMMTAQAITGSKLIRILVNRRAGDVGDTLANDAGLLGLMLTKA